MLWQNLTAWRSWYRYDCADARRQSVVDRGLLVVALVSQRYEVWRFQAIRVLPTSEVQS